ncbi:hypothetical protein GYMLUDRAFT_263922 [Collybiopsis luxurians FD-317 M1]|uniref:Uncharacterized protein n=1 Tax=Collybiopsis luxurians FD-317 M1 TaxID=944289 RepID=A0A0D0BM50_9AGAR|nr:hypothetical protein GYMLUDRAFT_263922 [Collybiopsis luxurians FD-317 M1]
MFNKSRNSSISHSNLSVAYGDQTIINTYCKHGSIFGDDSSSLDVGRGRSKRRRRNAIFDDFKEFRQGDMIILQRFDQRRSEISPGDITSIEVVKLASKKREKKFMAITYEGGSAYERWRRDLESFAHARDPSGWQLGC